MIPHLGLCLFLFGFGALGWWAASSLDRLYQPARLGVSYRVYLLLPLLWGRLVSRPRETESAQ